VRFRRDGQQFTEQKEIAPLDTKVAVTFKLANGQTLTFTPLMIRTLRTIKTHQCHVDALVMVRYIFPDLPFDTSEEIANILLD